MRGMDPNGSMPRFSYCAPPCSIPAPRPADTYAAPPVAASCTGGTLFPAGGQRDSQRARAVESLFGRRGTPCPETIRFIGCKFIKIK